MSEWISVKDKLPDEGGRYWCYVTEMTDLGVSFFQCNCAYTPHSSPAWSERFMPMHVTHWTRLLEPPKLQ